MKHAMTIAILVAGSLLVPTSPGLAQAVQVDPEIDAYERSSGVSGTLNSIGSDTLNNLMTLWAEGFQKLYPNVRVQIEGKGSSTAPPALIQGTAQIGPRPDLAAARDLAALEVQTAQVLEKGEARTVRVGDLEVGAEVMIVGLEGVVRTDADGRFVLRGDFPSPMSCGMNSPIRL